MMEGQTKMSMPQRSEVLSIALMSQILQVSLVVAHDCLHVTPRWLSFAISSAGGFAMGFYLVMRRNGWPGEGGEE